MGLYNRIEVCHGLRVLYKRSDCMCIILYNSRNMKREY